MRKPPSPPPPAGAVSGRGCSRRARARGAHREPAAASRQKSGDTEREFHHYGSGLRLFPNDTLALRAGFAASLGAFAAVDVETGAPSMAFHADPARLAWDDYSGDHGQNAFGALRESGCFVDNATEPGLLVGFGCDVGVAPPAAASAGPRITVMPTDAARRLVYLGPLGASLALRGSGAITSALVDFAARTATLEVAAPRADCGAAGAPPEVLRVALAVEAHPDWARATSLAVTDPPGAPLVRGAFEFPWQASVTVTWEE